MERTHIPFHLRTLYRSAHGHGDRGANARKQRPEEIAIADTAGSITVDDGPLGRWAAGPPGRWAAGPLGRRAAGTT
ncbi:hypothetical protein ACFRCX_37540, partial [Streptomyces sp. NPDC056652]|uniref:hypothetical protein n=1 Tax=Streptomyces sp. NPDC056652 TaxID=3345893 RepID=UPI0036795764